MEKRKKIKLVNVTAFVLALLIFFTGLCSVVYFIGGNGIFNMKGLEYPDYPAANVNPEIDSWTQWKSRRRIVYKPIDLDHVVVIAFPDQNSMIYKRILEKTGVKINFKKATSGDGTEIATKIAGNNLPDVVSIKANTTLKNELAKEQTCYPIQELASRWAPSLLKRLREDEEMVSYYEYSDGYIYGIPNNFYMTKDVETYGESGRSLVPTGAALARKDYLDAYHAYRREADPDFGEDEGVAVHGNIRYRLFAVIHDRRTRRFRPFLFVERRVVDAEHVHLLNVRLQCVVAQALRAESHLDGLNIRGRFPRVAIERSIREINGAVKADSGYFRGRRHPRPRQSGRIRYGQFGIRLQS